MKTYLGILLLLVSLSATAQEDSSKGKKYRLAMPDQWMGKTTVLDELTTRAVTVFAGLASKQFCFKCKTPFTLMFIYDSLKVESRVPGLKGTSTEFRFGKTQDVYNYECVTTYRFKASWMLLYRDSAIAELEIVSPSEKIQTIKTFKVNSNKMLIPTSLKNRPATMRTDLVNDPEEFVNKYPESFNPTVDDMLEVILERIRKIK